MSRLHVGRHNKGVTTRLSKHNNRKVVTPVQASGNLSDHSSSVEMIDPNESSDKGGEQEIAVTDGSRLHRPPRGKSNSAFGSTVSLGGSALGTHRFQRLGTPAGVNHTKRAMMQLEQEGDSDDSRDFEDYDDDSVSQATSQASPASTSKQLSLGLQPVEPTPPKMSDETVISVTSVASMATALKGVRDKARFVNDTDLNSSAVNISRNLGEMSQMLSGWSTSAKRKSLASLAVSVQGKPVRSNEKPSLVNSVYQTKDPRAFEKVFREYVNARAIRNPVLMSLPRVSKSIPDLSSKTGNNEERDFHNMRLPSARTANALVATTADAISEFTERRSSLASLFENSHARTGIENDFSQVLDLVWSGAWSGKDRPSEQALESGENKAAKSYEPQIIETQVTKHQAQQYSSRHRDSHSTIKLV